jgi:hypothetical protein
MYNKLTSAPLPYSTSASIHSCSCSMSVLQIHALECAVQRGHRRRIDKHNSSVRRGRPPVSWRTGTKTSASPATIKLNFDPLDHFVTHANDSRASQSPGDASPKSRALLATRRLMTRSNMQRFACAVSQRAAARLRRLIISFPCGLMHTADLTRQKEHAT